jgi:hypothetical protein
MGFVPCAGMLIIEGNDDGVGVFADLTTEEAGIACSSELVDVNTIVVKSVAVTITTASAIASKQECDVGGDENFELVNIFDWTRA